MSDSINALLQGQHASSVLQGIANPQIVNPLAAITAGNQAAQAEYQTRALQAQQAIGQILQQSTDPNGNVDYQKAHTLAAAAGPTVAMGMAKFAGEASQLKGEQLKNAIGLNSFVGSLAASLAMNPSDDNLAKIRAQAANAQLPASALAEIDRLQGLSFGERQAEAFKHILGRFDALNQMARTPYAPSSMVDAGGRFVPLQNTAPTPWGQGGAFVQPGGVTRGPDPNQFMEITVPADEDGNDPSVSGKPAAPGHTRVIRVPSGNVRGAPIPGQQVTGPPGTAPPAGGPGAPGSTPPVPAPGTIPGTGRRIPAPPGLGNPNAPAAPATGPRSALEGGTQVASADPSMAPSVGPAGPSSPTVAGDVAAIQKGMAGARNTPSMPGSQQQAQADTRPVPYVGPPQGQAEKFAKDSDQYIADQAAYPNVRLRTENLSHAYDALARLKMATGKGAPQISALRSWAQTLGIAPPGAVKDQELMDLVTKYTEREMINAAGGASTDMGRRMQEQANAGTSLSTAANFDVLRNDLGTVLRGMAAYKEHSPTNAWGYLKRRADAADQMDPRGMVWSMYSPEEQAAINASVAKNKDAADKLDRAIAVSRRLGLMPDLPSPPKPGAFLTPSPMPQQNPLIAPV